MPEDFNLDEPDEFFVVDPYEASLDEVPESHRSGPPAVTPGSGNRPADGARRARPGDVLSEDFPGTEAAGDFLGLDVDLTGESFGEEENAPELELAAAPGIATHTEQEDGEEDVNVLSDPFEDGEVAHLDEPLDDDLDELGYEEDGFDEDSPSGKKRSLLLVAGAFSIGLLLVFGAVFGPRFLNRGGAETPETIARAPQPTTPVTPPATPAGTPEVTDPVAVEPGPTDAANPVEEPTAEVIPDPVVEDPAPVVAEITPPVIDPVIEPVVDPIVETPPTGEFTLDLNGLGFDFVSGGDNPATPPGEATFDATLISRLDWVGDDPLEVIWRGTAVPMEAVASPARVIMPEVGSVRVFMHSSEVFEGRLVAMGQNRVEVETELGRMGLVGERVERVERLHLDPLEFEGGLHDAARGDLVRAKTVGGVLYGRVLNRKGNQVTLITDGGGKVTLTDPVIEPIGSRRAIVVDG